MHELRLHQTPQGLPELNENLVMEPMKPIKPIKPMKPITKDAAAAKSWWPPELGTPGVSGFSNNLRYAYFAARHRLVVHDGQRVKVYDTDGQAISGFSSNQGKALTFDVDGQSRKLSSLKLI